MIAGCVLCDFRDGAKKSDKQNRRARPSTTTNNNLLTTIGDEIATLYCVLYHREKSDKLSDDCKIMLTENGWSRKPLTKR